ncbi:pectate lyase [Rhizoctonia solani]|uniref:Pectate lyase n=1 Tax=Rhizoctonia solani TaxID=456999 RepID=A0A8H8T0X9_9AGAM|nr:pectate lyase [Rhizoctonia solani]QRW24162.1 pectate lyase [Rhizoctonia solani]
MYKRKAAGGVLSIFSSDLLYYQPSLAYYYLHHHGSALARYLCHRRRHVRSDCACAPSEKRAASCSFPNPSVSTNVKLSAARTIKAGETFDGKNLRYGRGVKCGGQKEGGTKDAVFILESGATLANAVIGTDQNEGVHCQGPCTIRNVWFEDVCEDAITIRQSSGTSTITGGGAKSASDKVVQHNGGGLVKIDSYCVQDFGKLYRSCGNCGTQVKRQVQISNIIARNGKLLAGVNSNFGDVATIDQDELVHQPDIGVRHVPGQQQGRRADDADQEHGQRQF